MNKFMAMDRPLSFSADLEQYLNDTSIWDTILEWAVSTVGKILIGLLVLYVGLKLIKVVTKILKKSFVKHNIEASVTSFLLSFISISLKCVLFLCAAGIMGLQVTSFITLLGSAGIAVGLALQGSLANIAGGVLILMLKPFQVGDYIIEDNKGNEGTVVGIDIFYTKLRTTDNKIIVVPNGIMSNNSLTNVTMQDKRLLNLTVGIEYSQELLPVKEILYQILDTNPNVLQDESKNIFVSNFDDSAITMGIRAYVPTSLYWVTRCAVLEEIKLKFDENHISIPYNKLDVNIINQITGERHGDQTS